MSKKITRLEGIGDIEIIKKHNRKSLKLQVKPFESPQLLIPYHYPFQKAENFLFQYTDWLKLHLKKKAEIEQAQRIFKEDSVFQLSTCQILFSRSSSPEYKVTGKGNDYVIHVPDAFPFKNNHTQQQIREQIIKILRAEAREYLPLRVQSLAAKFHFTYQKVRIKNVKTLWGSCSSKNNINLNLHLMRLPLYLIDYVILHELAHTQIKNHGKPFWDKIDELTGNGKKLAKELKKYTTTFY